MRNDPDQTPKRSPLKDYCLTDNPIASTIKYRINAIMRDRGGWDAIKDVLADLAFEQWEKDFAKNRLFTPTKLKYSLAAEDLSDEYRKGKVLSLDIYVETSNKLANLKKYKDKPEIKVVGKLTIPLATIRVTETIPSKYYDILPTAGHIIVSITPKFDRDSSGTPIERVHLFPPIKKD